jgi:hypothetical protein
MKLRSLRSATWLATLAVLIMELPTKADDLPSRGAAERNQKIQRLMEESVEWYKLLPKTNARTPLKPQVVMSWRNAARGEQAKDFLVLWVDKGRPAAAASVFPWDGKLCHEFGLLSRETGLEVRNGEEVVWVPRTAGVAFRDIPDAPEPADSAGMRLRQIKSLAERVSATLIGWKTDGAGPEELRLLPRPLYRYEIEDSESSHDDPYDGALLAFVQGTDPELLLLLEAVVIDKRPRWQYAFSRSTSGGLEVRLGKQVVWTVEELADTESRTQPHIVLRRKIEK